MIRLNNVVELWSEWLIHSGWQTAVVVAAAAVLLQLGRRTSAQFRYAILVIALAKFAVPPFLSLSVGLFSHARMPVDMEATVTIVDGEISSGGSESNGRLPTDLPGNHTITSTLPTNQPVPSGMPEQVRVPEPSVAESAMFPWLAFALFCIHGMGILVAIFFVWRQYRSVQNLIVNSTPAPEEILQLARATAIRLGIRKIPDIVISNESDAPFATGLLKQIILLPRSALELPADHHRPRTSPYSKARPSHGLGRNSTQGCLVVSSRHVVAESCVTTDSRRLLR